MSIFVRKQVSLKNAMALFLVFALFFAAIAPAAAVQKISNPDIRGGADGIDADPDIGQHNSYSWCGAVFEQTDADYLWIGSNRDLGGTLFTNVEIPVPLTYLGIPEVSPDAVGKIYRQRLSDPGAPWELAYENPAVNGYRKMVVFNGDLYVFVGLSRMRFANYAFILRFSKDFKAGDLPEIVFWDNLPATEAEYFRSAAIKDGELYIGTFDAKIYKTDGTGLQNLVPNISPKSVGWTYELKLEDYGLRAGTSIWDMIAFSDSLYAFCSSWDLGVGFSIVKITPDSGGGSGGGSGGYIVEQIVGDESAPYPYGFGCGNYAAASPFISTSFDKEYMYVSTFSGGTQFLTGLGAGLVEETLDSLFGPCQILRVDADGNWEVVVGDTIGKYVAVDKYGDPLPHAGSQRSGFSIQDDDVINTSFNLYTWWMAEYEGKLYAATFDPGIIKDFYPMLCMFVLNGMTDDAFINSISYLNDITEALRLMYENAGDAYFQAFLKELRNYIQGIELPLYNEDADSRDILERVKNIASLFFPEGNAAALYNALLAMSGELKALGLNSRAVTVEFLSYLINTAPYFMDESNPAGFDLYVSEDGKYFEPISVDGFGDPGNYGGRVLLPSAHGLYLGTANPFNGTQVWRVDPIEHEIFVNGPREALLGAGDEAVVTVLVNKADEGGGTLNLDYNSDIADIQLVKRAPATLTDISWDISIETRFAALRNYYVVSEIEAEYIADIYDAIITPSAPGSEELTLNFEIDGISAQKTIALTVDLDFAAIVDKTLLGERLELASGLTEEDLYTAATWLRFVDAKTAAQGVYDDDGATQAQVNRAQFDLSYAMSGLILKPGAVDKTALGAMLGAALLLKQGDYTPATWITFNTTRNAALFIFGNPDSSQATVDAAIEALRAKMAALVPLAVADKTALETLLTAAASLAEEDYTDETWASFSAARAAAQLVYDKNNAVQSQVDAAAANLSAAMNALEAVPPAPADKTALGALLDSAAVLVEEDYTPESWAPFADMLVAALDIYDDANATQEQVDLAFAELSGALIGLVSVIPVDKSALGALLDAAAGLFEEDYTQASWALFTGVYNGALSVYDNAGATQNHVDEAAADLLDAIGALVYAPDRMPADKIALGVLLDTAAAFIEADYTAGSWLQFQDAYAAARSVYDETGATKGQVDAAIAYLEAAIDGLTASSPQPAVDKSELLALLDQAAALLEADYTPDSWAAFAAARGAAVFVSEDAGATQNQVNAARMNLTLAIMDLEPAIGADKSMLETLLDTAAGYAEANYTADSWSRFAAAYGAARLIYNDAGATPAQVAGAASALSDAIAALTRVAGTRGNPGGGGSGSASGAISAGGGSSNASGEGQTDDGVVGFIPDDDEIPGGAAADMPFDMPFTDVAADDWFYDYVVYVYQNGLMTGTETTPMLFSPDMTLTRAMVVTVLYRLSGMPDVEGFENLFSDVEAGTWYTDAVIWAVANDIAIGYGDGLFGPEDYITREQMAKIILDYAKFTGKGPVGAWAVRLEFDDIVDISDWAFEGVMYCYMKGIIVGKPHNLFDPLGGATRAEFATVLTRYLQ